MRRFCSSVLLPLGFNVGKSFAKSRGGSAEAFILRPIKHVGQGRASISLQTSPLFDSIPDKEIVSLQRQGSYSDKVRSLIEAFLSTTQHSFQDSQMQATTSPQANTSEVRVCPLSGHVFTSQEAAQMDERVERVRQLCAERCSSSPSWQKRVARNPEFWNTFSPGGIR